MKRYLFYITISFLSFFLSSCEKDKFDTFDVKLSPPFIIDAKLDKYIIDSDTILFNGQYSLNDTIIISNRIQIKVSDQDGISDIVSVKFRVKGPNNREIFTGTASDKGLESDSLANDGIFSSKFSSKIPRTLTGTFFIETHAEDKSRLLSNFVITTFSISRLRKAPMIFNLQAPDSVTLPVSGSKLIQMSIAAFDSNGLADIKEVYFRSLDSSDPTKKYFMYDDGSETILFPPDGRSGDEIKGDGIYTINVELPYNMTPKPYRFEFEAQDFAGLLSNKILHTLNVIRP